MEIVTDLTETFHSVSAEKARAIAFD